MISIIIPVYNEERHLRQTLDSIQLQRSEAEVILVDGGSTDGSVAIAAETCCKILHSPRRQRAAQMNLGAAAAAGDVLLFLHADTKLAADALPRLEAVLQNTRIVGGCFAKRYDRPTAFLHFAALAGEMRSRGFGWYFGDQAIFIRQETFRRLDGYRDMNIFEDLDLSRRMSSRGRTSVLHPPVISSSRRFLAKGPLLTTCRDTILTVRFLLDARSGRNV